MAMSKYWKRAMRQSIIFSWSV